MGKVKQLWEEQNMISQTTIDALQEISKPLGQNPVDVNAIQHGGNHYKKYGDLQPWDVITAWNLGYLDGTALKYIASWRDKNGVEDLKMAIHFLQKTIDVETKKNER